MSGTATPLSTSSTGTALPAIFRLTTWLVPSSLGWPATQEAVAVLWIVSAVMSAPPGTAPSTITLTFSAEVLAVFVRVFRGASLSGVTVVCALATSCTTTSGVMSSFSWAD